MLPFQIISFTSVPLHSVADFAGADAEVRHVSCEGRGSLFELVDALIVNGDFLPRLLLQLPLVLLSCPLLFELCLCERLRLALGGRQLRLLAVVVVRPRPLGLLRDAVAVEDTAGDGVPFVRPHRLG